VQVFLPGAGWMEFDPTNGIVGSHDLIRVAIGRDPAQAVPLWGSWTGFPSDALGLTVEVHVTASTVPSLGRRETGPGIENPPAAAPVQPGAEAPVRDSPRDPIASFKG
jgi:hypothetical protein